MRKNKVCKTVLKYGQIKEIYTQRELLNAKIIVKYKADLQDRELEHWNFLTFHRYIIFMIRF